MRRTLFLTTRLLQIAVLMIPAGFEYYSTRNMGVYRYLVAFNYRQEQFLLMPTPGFLNLSWLSTPPNFLSWLGAAFIGLFCVFAWQYLHPKQYSSKIIPAKWGMAGSGVMLILIELTKAQAF